MEQELDDAALDGWLWAECSDAQHASGTCRMGDPADRRDSVVDLECQVIGCTGLRVIDASIMPTVPRANTHLTTVAIAEKMADRFAPPAHIVERIGAAPSTARRVPPYVRRGRPYARHRPA